MPLGGVFCPSIACRLGQPYASLLETLSWRAGPSTHQLLEGGLNASLLSSRINSTKTLKSKLRTPPAHTHHCETSLTAHFVVALLVSLWPLYSPGASPVSSFCWLPPLVLCSPPTTQFESVFCQENWQCDWNKKTLCIVSLYVLNPQHNYWQVPGDWAHVQKTSRYTLKRKFSVWLKEH